MRVEGSLNGDRVLVAIAAAIVNSSRQSDMCGRYGGEEFIVVTPVDREKAMIHGQRLIDVVRALEFDFAGKRARVTMSVGVAAYEDHHGDGAGLLHDADRALYQAKSKGRDRVEATPAVPRDTAAAEPGSRPG